MSAGHFYVRLAMSGQSKAAFRLKSKTVNRLYAPLWVTVVLVPALLLFLGGTKSLYSTAFSTVLTLVVILCGYVLTKRYVWIALSSEGIFGTGATNRSIAIQWNEPLIIKTAVFSGIKGINIGRVSDNPVSRALVKSFFVPTEIITSEEFAIALSRYASPNHPLFSFGKSPSAR
jgi:hypothetical protein